MKRLLLFLCTIFFLYGCNHRDQPLPVMETTEETAQEVLTVPPETVPPDPIREMMNAMSLEERVGQLFLARCDDAVALEHITDLHLGGFVLFGRDFQNQTPESLRDKLSGYQNQAKIPLFIAVDEEGGTVVRVSSNPAFRTQKFRSPRSLYKEGGLERVLAEEQEKCFLLRSLGINVNLGPVCDLATDPSAFMYDRALGENADITAQFAEQMVSLMKANYVGSCLKHFPGYGNNADTHTGIAVDYRSLEELENNDLLPFAAGIQAGCDAILVSHTIVDALDSQIPASLSPAVHRYLRDTMGFEGVIVTDDLVMQAITDAYGAGEAAVLAVLAGNDLLCSTEYIIQYDAVLTAVLEGRIDIDTLNNAVRNVLEWKTSLGLL